MRSAVVIKALRSPVTPCWVTVTDSSLGVVGGPEAAAEAPLGGSPSRLALHLMACHDRLRVADSCSGVKVCQFLLRTSTLSDVQFGTFGFVMDNLPNVSEVVR